jgi:flagellin-like protein
MAKKMKNPKHSQNLLQCKKAISPILATLLLIVIVVAAGIAAYAWIQSSTTTQMTQASGFIIIENVRFYDSNQVELTIRNAGIADIKIDTVYIDEVGNPVEQNIAAKESSTFVIDYSWEIGTRYTIKVASTAGLFAEGLYNTPSQAHVWYDQSWMRRKAVTIDNTLNSNDLSNYQVQFNVQYDSDMNTDFSDLRFTDSDKQTSIPYWIESYTASDSATVWVKVPSISASSTKTIYMYYGNPSASSESNPDNTFEIFVDFTSDGVISHGGGQDSDSTQWQIIDDTILRMWGNNWKATMKTLTVAGDGSQAICFDFLSNGTQGEINGIGLDTDNSISENRFYRIYGTQNWGINDHYGYAGGGVWQSYTLILDDYNGDFDRVVFTNDADASQATNIYYRNVRVSGYTSPQPTANMGTEETQ